MHFGIDLGGTKIEIIVLDENGQEVHRKRVNTPQGDYQATIHSIVTLVREAETVADFAANKIGIGTPGAISQTTGLMKNSNSVCLNGKPLLQDLQQALACPVIVANDANCFALSEAVDGAGAGASVVFGVIIGTGSGGGIVVNGKVLTGANAIAGEWGHNPLPWPRTDELPGPPCYCGKTGCIETWLSGPGLQAFHARTTGENITPHEIVKRAEAGDKQAESSLAEYEDRLARSLAGVINILDPDIIVLGGGLSNIARLYKNVPKLWPKYVFSDSITTRLLPAKYGDSSGVRGAAWLNLKTSVGIS
jgi:predicted NBD/HSP70 family sugar kinase